jgi:hypothetical protein
MTPRTTTARRPEAPRGTAYILGDRASAVAGAPPSGRPQSVTRRTASGPSHHRRIPFAGVTTTDPHVPYTPVVAGNQNSRAAATIPQIISPAARVASVVMMVTAQPPVRIVLLLVRVGPQLVQPGEREGAAGRGVDSLHQSSPGLDDPIHATRANDDVSPDLPDVSVDVEDPKAIGLRRVPIDDLDWCPSPLPNADARRAGEPDQPAGALDRHARP